MTTMMHWSPFTQKFHLHHHHVEDLFPRFVDDTTDATAPPAASWLPAAEGRLEDGTYIIQFALPGSRGVRDGQLSHHQGRAEGQSRLHG